MDKPVVDAPLPPVKFLIASLLVMAMSMMSSAVMAHGDPPAGQSVHVVDGDHVYITNFGVLSAAWPDRYVCEEAFFASQSFRVAPLRLHHWVIVTRSSVAVTFDGCDFDRVLDLPAFPTSLVSNTDDDDEVAFIVQDGGLSQLWYSDDGGLTWAQIGIDVNEIRLTGIGFLASQRLLLVGYRTGEDLRGAAFLAEFDLNDGAQTEHDVGEDLRYPDLLDARNGDFLWHARRDDVNEVYWSQPGDLEAGRFQAPRWPTSGAIAPDGSAAYLGGVDAENRGVFSALRHEPSTWTEIVAGHRALCMTATDDALYICGHRHHDDHDLARWTATDGLEDLVDFRNLLGIRDDCPADSLTTLTCPAIWPETARALGIEITADEPDISDEPAEDLDESGCSTYVGSAPPPGFLLLLLIGSVLRRARPAVKPTLRDGRHNLP